MRSKLALILALAAFLALAAVGTAPAASPLAAVTEGLLGGSNGMAAGPGRNRPGRNGPSLRHSSAGDDHAEHPGADDHAIGPGPAAVRGRHRQRRRRPDRPGRPRLHLAHRQHRGPGTGTAIRRLPRHRRSTPLTLDLNLEGSARNRRRRRPNTTRSSARANRSKRNRRPTPAAASPTTKISATPAAAARVRWVTAPSATGGGTQPLVRTSDGGAQFEPGGAPTLANPTTTIAPFGPAPIGVPNFVINSFEIPPFLLPIYQACGTEYGIPWEVLAAINKIETGFGTNLNVSSAGAVGWMQFLPSSWETYGLDANGDGRKDPYNPVDAICAAAHYLKVAGGQKHLYDAILAYNHADWYAQEVLPYARAYGRIPSNLVGSLTGLTEGAHFPIAANARYSDELAARAGDEALDAPISRVAGNAAEVISSSPTRARDQHLRQEGLAGRRRQRRRDPQDWATPPSSATSSSSKTPTATATPTPASASWSATAARSSPPGGKKKKVPVESQELRPRLRALPQRSRQGGAEGTEGPKRRSPRLPKRRPGPARSGSAPR